MVLNEIQGAYLEQSSKSQVLSSHQTVIKER